MSEETKFEKSKIKPEKLINNQKRKINDIIIEINKAAKCEVFKKITGHYGPGYIYGNCKIHKNKKNPPLRPVISTIPTPSYEISKSINEIISQYMPTSYNIRSTKEFIEILKTQSPNNIMASLDVESLFTNVPVNETIDITLDYCYCHPELAAPIIPK